MLDSPWGGQPGAGGGGPYSSTTAPPWAWTPAPADPFARPGSDQWRPEPPRGLRRRTMVVAAVAVFSLLGAAVAVAVGAEHSGAVAARARVLRELPRLEAFVADRRGHGWTSTPRVDVL